MPAGAFKNPESAVEKTEGFIAWAVKGLATDGFGTWLVKNFDTIAVCLLAGFGVNIVAAFHRKSDFRSLAYGFLATFFLIGSFIWLADDYGVRKVFWPIISLAIGGASLSIVGAYLRFVTRLEEKLPNAAADAVADRAASIIRGGGDGK